MARHGSADILGLTWIRMGTLIGTQTGTNSSLVASQTSIVLTRERPRKHGYKQC
jgi:hypothetical protein